MKKDKAGDTFYSPQLKNLSSSEQKAALEKAWKKSNAKNDETFAPVLLKGFSVNDQRNLLKAAWEQSSPNVRMQKENVIAQLEADLSRPAQMHDIFVSAASAIKLLHGTDLVATLYDRVIEEMIRQGLFIDSEKKARSIFYDIKYFLIYSNPDADDFSDREKKFIEEVKHEFKMNAFTKKKNMDDCVGSAKHERELIKERYKSSSWLRDRDQIDQHRFFEILQKSEMGWELMKDDLIFLYERDVRISERDGRDPRIEQLRNQRDSKRDAQIIFEDVSSIAWKEEDISMYTKVYIGPLSKRIFSEYPQLEYIYTSFPNGRVLRHGVEYGGKTVDDLHNTMEDKGIYMSFEAQELFKKGFSTQTTESGYVTLIRVKVESLFSDRKKHRRDEIYHRAKELYGLELCPIDIAPYYRLATLDQPEGEHLYFAMKEINGNKILTIEHSNDDGYGLEFNVISTIENLHGPEHEFVFLSPINQM